MYLYAWLALAHPLRQQHYASGVLYIVWHMKIRSPYLFIDLYENRFTFHGYKI